LQYYVHVDVHHGGKEIVVIMRMETGVGMGSSVVVA